MTHITYSISEEIFNHFPGYMRGVVLARQVANRLSPPDLVAILRDEEKSLRSRLNAETLAAHPRLLAWREAFRSIGIKPSEFRPSIEAMARRVVNGNDLPAINALVDIGNIISLRHLLPTGGHALDHVTGSIALRPASGEEVFIPFGSDQEEHPGAGEFIFTEGNTVLTRRWVWRQSNHTLTELDTTFIEFNIDGLEPATHEDIRLAGEDLMALVARYCGGTAEMSILDASSRELSIEI